MKDVVSSRWITLVALVASMAVICTVLVHYGYPGMALAGVGLLLSAGVFLSLKSTKSIGDVLRDVDAEPGLADAVPAHAVATSGARPGFNAKGTR